MNKLVALSLAIGGVGGIMTWIYTQTPLALSIPISFIGMGESYNDLIKFDKNSYIESLIKL